MSLDRPAPRGYRRAWRGGAPPPRVDLGTLSMKMLRMVRDGEQFVVQPDEAGCLVARRGLDIVAISDQPGPMLAAVRAQSGVAVGTVTSLADGPPGYVTLALS